ncbi:FecCD family ABC transporter permease [Nocardioides alcanivorans]|uniref:FecCD family ABC transporter permease n=1 Tax=Nocardioides alcanivorans TaxID=2897352 RepID=UPI001F4907B6|nr:iron ABC transporter permease [Nocardioides alcanivorans]
MRLGLTRSARISGTFLLILLALLGLAVLISLAFGSRSIPFGEVLASLLHGVDSDNATVITSQRLPRTLLGLAAGVALGMAGALMQGHTRNPLADPGLFGVNAGATFAVAVLTFGFSATSTAATVIAALLGAATVTTAVFVLGLRGQHTNGLAMLAIIGTTAAVLLSSLTSALILLDRQTLDVMRFWEVGSLANRNQDLMLWLVPIMTFGALLALHNSFSLNALGLGDEVAQSLGTRVRTTRVTGIVAITLLVGPVTALCGPIAFLGLVAPHAARFVTGHDQRWLVPCAGIIGGCLILVADTVGRVIPEHGELQVGIVLAFVGAPVLLAITRHRRLVSL